MRYGGYVDWDAIVDRGRIPKTVRSLSSAVAAMQDAINTFRVDRQGNQEVKVEVWSEKDAISEILFNVTAEYGISLVINKGYSSSTAMHEAYQRFISNLNAGRMVKILYFGDHDASGLDMIRDIKDRIVYFFVNGDLGQKRQDEIIDWWNQMDHEDRSSWITSCMTSKEAQSLARKTKTANAYLRKLVLKYKIQEQFQVIQVGLTKEQIYQFDLPPNPAKSSDPRAKKYYKEHGSESWEVDGLDPPDMVDILTKAIEENIDIDLFNAMVNYETEERNKLKDIKIDE